MRHPYAAVGLISLLINHVVWYMSITRLRSGGAHEASFLQDDYFRNYSSLSEIISISLFLFLSPVLSGLRSFEARSQILHCRYLSSASDQFSREISRYRNDSEYRGDKKKTCEKYNKFSRRVVDFLLN